MEQLLTAALVISSIGASQDARHKVFPGSAKMILIEDDCLGFLVAE